MTTDTLDATGQETAEGLPYLPCELRTERLCLRPVTKDDLDKLHPSYQKRKDVQRYLQWEVHDHDEPTKNLEKRLAMSRLAEDGDGLIYAVELPEPDGGHERIIGNVSIFLKSAKDAQFEIGWVFHPAVYGQGLAPEAAEALLDLCFNTLSAHRVFAELDSRNEASARLCERLGMRKEALLLERELVDDEWHDMAIFGLLAAEYAERVGASGRS